MSILVSLEVTFLMKKIILWGFGCLTIWGQGGAFLSLRWEFWGGWFQKSCLDEYNKSKDYLTGLLLLGINFCHRPGHSAPWQNYDFGRGEVAHWGKYIGRYFGVTARLWYLKHFGDRSAGANNGIGRIDVSLKRNTYKYSAKLFHSKAQTLITLTLSKN